ncbi:hypothetical protein EV421DRAFT_1733978 [Armillaria borealis]|uniref:Uncharacterized protein n=1 Tax=Armillaria borealis TaxID=47425 RepID=A0AA39JPU7_9AGAR|nr:hypothetical protein EV421DRAFT_1733978 [Armillaria borealis]
MASTHAKQSNNNDDHSKTSDDSEEDDHSTFSCVSKGTNDEYVVTCQSDFPVFVLDSDLIIFFRVIVDELSVTNACVPHILGCIVKLAIFNVKAGAIVVMNDRGKDT